jgi:transposase-like protein
MSKSKKSCPRCTLEKIKTELNLLPNDTLSCPKGHWVEKEVQGKLAEIFNCPRCALENVKTELKNALIIT